MAQLCEFMPEGGASHSSADNYGIPESPFGVAGYLCWLCQVYYINANATELFRIACAGCSGAIGLTPGVAPECVSSCAARFQPSV